jgi:hypothetical protein
MLLSGALLGLISEDASAANAVGFISSDSPSGVSVTFINQETGASQSVTSSADGSYSFNNLDDGEYSVRYSKVGFLSVLDTWSVPSDLPLDDVAMVLAPAGSTSVTVNVKDGGGTDINGASVHQESSVVADIKETVAPLISVPPPSFTFTVTLVEPAGARYIATSSNGKSEGTLQVSNTDKNPTFEYLTEYSPSSKLLNE